MAASVDSDRLERIEGKLDILTTDVEELNGKVGVFADKVERFDDKFDTYQKSMQWVVQLAFTLIASATITIILSTVLK